MSSITIVAIAVGVALVGIVAWYLFDRRRSETLQARYGREYARTLDEAGDRRSAEAELLRRQERVEHLDIRPLSADQRRDYAERYHAVQSEFVDDPRHAVTDADALIEDVMKARGYPVADFDQRAADISVHHAHVVDNYRAARDIAQRHRRGEANTEDLRQAMVYYRELFEDLLEDRESHAAEHAAEHDEEHEREVERSVARDADRQRRADARDLRDDDDHPIHDDREVRP